VLGAHLPRISRPRSHLTEVSGRTLAAETTVGPGVVWVMPTDGESPRRGSVGSGSYFRPIPKCDSNTCADELTGVGGASRLLTVQQVIS
jgi:hypothetical protein